MYNTLIRKIQARLTRFNIQCAVACKVIACNIKRWAEANEGSVEALLLIVFFVMDAIGPITVIFNEQWAFIKANRSGIFQIVA